MVDVVRAGCCRRDEHAVSAVLGDVASGSFSGGSVVIPVHNEEAILGESLDRLQPLVESGQLEVVVACNGCSDASPQIARSHRGVAVVELSDASKTAALNAADGTAVRWPRVYLDADIWISPRTLQAMFAAVDCVSPRAARAPYRYDSTGASVVVRAYYRARSRIAARSQDLWGAGTVALNEAAHYVVGDFPDVVADDLFISSVLPDDCKVAVDADPVIVRTPRTVADLLRILRRSQRGNRELATAAAAHHVESTAPRTMAALLTTIRSPQALLDAGVYAAAAVVARGLARRRTVRWERDESSRVQAGSAS